MGDVGTTAGGANFVGRRGWRGRGEAASRPGKHGDLLFTREVVTQTVKDLPAMWEMFVRSLGCEEDPLEEDGHRLQYTCLKNPHGWGRLAGYSPRGGKESDVLSD